MANQVIVTNTGNVQVALTPPANVQVQISRAAIGTVSNVLSANFANYAANVTASNQPNITNVGTLGNLSVTGTVTSGNVNTPTVYSQGMAVQGYDFVQMQYSNGANLPLSPYDIGTGSWFYLDSGGATFQSNTTGAFKQLVIGNDGGINANGNVSAPYYIGNGSQLTGIVATGGNANYANFAGNVTGANQPNITNVGTLGNLTVSNTITTLNLNVTGNLAVGNLVANSANYANFAGQAFNVNAANITGTVANANFAAYSEQANNANLATFATTANSVAGANVSGIVANANFSAYSEQANTANLATYATTANAVAVANVSGIGNIATTNYDGNASNVLYGNGGFYALPTVSNVANANYANFAGTAYSVDGANVSGTVANANFSAYSEQANNANLATYATTANAVAGANVSGEVANANFASYANIASTANSVNVANVVGIGNIATTNYDGNAGNILYGNGGFYALPVISNVANANFAAYAGNVTVNAQANITSVGTLSSLSVTGNIQGGNILSSTFQAVNSAGGALKNASGASQLQWGAGGGNNLTVDVNININPANGQVDISPTGNGGHVHIKPTGNNSVEIAPTTAGVINNMIIGNVTPQAANVTTLGASGNITGANANLGNLVIANYFSGDGSLLSNISGANVSNIANANYANFAGQVVDNTQSNITLLGTLTDLVMSNSNVHLGTNASTNSQGTSTIAIGNSAASGGTIVNATYVDYDYGTVILTVSSTAGIVRGMTITGTGFTSGQYVYEVLDGTTLYPSEDPDSTPSGTLSFNSGQQTDAIAIGHNAGNVSQLANSIAIGSNAGSFGQFQESIAIGSNAASNSQGFQSIAIGLSAGSNSQGPQSVAIGYLAGNNTQGQLSFAMGYQAGGTNQGSSSVAVGANAGATTQGSSSVAIGSGAGKTNQGANAVAIGSNSGNISQGAGAVAIGISAGNSSMGANAVAIGRQAGFTGQGANSVAIGRYAGTTNQAANSIIINGTGANLNQTTANTFTVKPVRNANTSNVMFYNNSTGEISYDVATGITANSANFANFAGQANTANLATFATTANAVAGANVSGQVANALIAGTVYTNAQPNITSTGNLINLNIDNGVAGSTTKQFQPNGISIGSTANTNLMANSSFVDIDYGNGQGDGNVLLGKSSTYLKARGNASSLTAANVSDRVGRTNYMFYNGTANVLAAATQVNPFVGVTFNTNANAITTAGQYQIITGNPSGDQGNANALSNQNLYQFDPFGRLAITQGAAGSTSVALLINTYGGSAGNAAVGAQSIFFQRARGNRDGNLSVQPNDQLGGLNFVGHNGTGYFSTRNAGITALVDSTYVANTTAIPVGLRFQTTDNTTTYTTTFSANGSTTFPGSVATSNGISVTMNNINTVSSSFAFSTYNNANSLVNPYTFYRARGNLATPAAAQVSDTISSITYNIYADSGNTFSSVASTSVIVSDNDGAGNVAATYSITAKTISLTGNVTASNVSINTNGFMKLATYTKAALNAITGQVGWMACVTNSAGGGNPNGMFAFWDTTNSRWSYVHDNNAV
jgi:hypothetical protein